MSPKTVGLIAHTGKPGAADLVRQLQSEFETAGVKVVGEGHGRASLVCNPGRTVAELGTEADLLVVLGGDGTILNVVSGLEDTHQADLRNQHRLARVSHLPEFIGLSGSRAIHRQRVNLR